MSNQWGYEPDPRDMRDEMKNGKPKKSLATLTGELKRFPEQPPEGEWIAFIDPEEQEDWIAGRVDWYHIRTNDQGSYSKTDPRLTFWIPLPSPSDLLPSQTDNDAEKECE